MLPGFFCNGEVESIDQVLKFCPTVDSLWNNLSLKIYKFVSKRVNFNFNFINIFLERLLSQSQTKLYIFLLILDEKQ